MGRVLNWNGHQVEDAWKSWCSTPSNNNIKALPSLVCWGTWLARNSTIFRNKDIPFEVIAAQCIGILAHFPQEKGGQKIREIQAEMVDCQRP
jgi:hypothetical protein